MNNTYPKPRTLQELVTWKPLNPPEIISHGLLPKGHIMFVYGEQETWKSWLMLDLAFSIASNNNWLLYKTQPVRVLLLNPEIPEYQYRKRILSYVKAKNLNIPNDLIHFWTNLDIRLDDALGRTYLADQVKQIQPDLIIVDGLEFVCRGDVSSGTVAGGIRDTVNSIRSMANCSFIFVHHKRKDTYDINSQRHVNLGVNDMYGHSILKNIADTILEVSKDPENDQSIHPDVIYITSRKIRMSEASKPPPIPYKFDRSTYTFQLYI
jgi:RecA-family ATPase